MRDAAASQSLELLLTTRLPVDHQEVLEFLPVRSGQGPVPIEVKVIVGDGDDDDGLYCAGRVHSRGPGFGSDPVGGLHGLGERRGL